MKLKSTDPNESAASQARRRRNAVLGAVLSTVYRLLAAGMLIWLRASLDPSGFLAKLILLFAVLDLGSILPIWISLKARLKEIQGGEEDAAAQY